MPMLQVLGLMELGEELLDEISLEMPMKVIIQFLDLFFYTSRQAPGASCENDMHRNRVLGLKMGISPSAHT